MIGNQLLVVVLNDDGSHCIPCWGRIIRVGMKSIQFILEADTGRLGGNLEPSSPTLTTEGSSWERGS